MVGSTPEKVVVPHVLLLFAGQIFRLPIEGEDLADLVANAGIDHSKAAGFPLGADSIDMETAIRLDEPAIRRIVPTKIVHTLSITARRQPTRLSRVCALLLTATVLMLAVFAASPNVHQWLHADANHADHECAITLYAQGITTAAVGVALAVIAWRLLGLSQGAGIELFLPAPRFLHLPGRAPPRG